MKNELTVLTQLRQTIADHINEYLAEGLDGVHTDSVVIKWPNVDQMKRRVMFFIQPDYAEYDNLATTNDFSEFHVKVFIFCKRGAHTTLEQEGYGYYNGLYELLRRDSHLGGYVDFTRIVQADFYNAVDSTGNVSGTEVDISIQYTKDFD